MKVEVKQNVLLGMLEKAVLAMPSKGEQNPIQFALDGQELLISCDDGDLFITVNTEVVEFDEEGIVFLPAFFKDIVKRSEGDSITLEIDENNMFLYDNLGFSSNIRVQTRTPSNVPEVNWEDAITFNREKFVRSLDSVKLAISAESGQPALMQAKMSNGMMIGTNSARYHEAPLDEGLDELESTVPQQVVDPILKILNMSEAAEISFVVGEVESGIIVGDTHIIFSKLEYEYPEWINKIPMAVEGNDMKFYVNRTDLSKKVDKVSVTIDPASKNLSCSIDGNVLTLTAKDQVGNTSKDKVLGKDDGASGRSFDVNYKYISDALTALKGIDITLRLGKDKGNKRAAVVLEDGYAKCIFVQTVVG